MKSYRAKVQERFPQAFCDYRVMRAAFCVWLAPDLADIASGRSEREAWKNALKCIAYADKTPKERHGLLRLSLPTALLLMIFSGFAFAQSPPCDGLARACSAAADELKAARSLIAAQETELTATKNRLEIEQQRAKLEGERAELYKAQADNLTASLAAERQAKDAVQKLSDEQAKRIANLEGRLNRL